MRKRRHDRSASGRSSVRCAIYTRKSSEEGLEQDFNSLDAQREACEAYILSQKHEGWIALPADVRRRRLLRRHHGAAGAAAAARRHRRPAQIDIVVVYKVDRLTRSLADFAKIVEVFDRHGVTFVSVTQSFNTTTSMGRLTLNVLLVLRPVRARGHRRAHPRQDRRLEAQGHVDGRSAAARLRRRRTASSSSTTARPRPSAHIFRRYAELGSVRAPQGRARCARHRQQARGSIASAARAAASRSPAARST